MNSLYTERPWGDGTLIRVERGNFAFEAFSLGAFVVDVQVSEQLCPGRSVTLGFDDPESYKDPLNMGYIGANIGRFANRIRDARFGNYRFEANWRTHQLHGGPQGFSYQHWEHKPYTNEAGERVGVVFSRVSPDGEGGYPGTVAFEIIMSLDVRSELEADFEIRHRALPDSDTPINTTHHVYWNFMGTTSLEGHYSHALPLERLEADDDLLPTGRILPASQDYGLEPGELDLAERAAKIEGGYDCYFIAPKTAGAGALCEAFAGSAGDAGAVARAGQDAGLVPLVRMSTSRMQADFLANTDGFQFYTAGAMGEIMGRKPYGPYAGFCVEPSSYMDALNIPSFPSTIVKAGERYDRRMLTRFAPLV